VRHVPVKRDSNAVWHPVRFHSDSAFRIRETKASAHAVGRYSNEQAFTL
jgi:hypothetical protein